MRKLLYVVLGLAFLYGGYWFVGSTAVERGFKAWFAARLADGWVAEYDTLNTIGFPSRFDTTITGLELADPVTGLAWSAPFFQALTLSYQPQKYIAVWPDSQTIATPYEKITVNTSQMRASVVFQPGPSFTLDHSAFILDDLALSSTAGWSFSARNGRFATRQTPTVPLSHDIGIEALDVVPDLSQLRIVDPSSILPDVIERMKIDAVVGFDAPWDRTAIETRRPQPTRIKLNLVQATWGKLDLQLAGEVTVADGVPAGKITVRAKNWREMIDVAVNAGLIPPSMVGVVTGAGEMLAGLSGNSETLDAPLSFQNGFMSFGPIPLGRAPLLVIR